METKQPVNIKADVILDAFGLICPMPIAKTCQIFKQMEVGQILEVIADDDGIVEDMPSWCSTTGNEFLGMTEENGEYHAFVKKTTDEKKECLRPPCNQPDL
jgi:tRNA 2-thiouridine synthesizing protein A